MYRKGQILVVDDNPTSLEVYQEILDGEYSFVTASNAEEATRQVGRHEPRVVLLDVMLPGMDGYELCRVLRRLPGMQTSRIIMVSALAMPSERAAGFDAGADAYLTKPFDDAELLAVIRDEEQRYASATAARRWGI